LYSIQSQTRDGRPKHIGGDTWRIHIHGRSSFSPTIIDHANGTYEVLFLVMEPGEYRVNVFLEYTLCEGFKDPLDKWFVAGKLKLCFTSRLNFFDRDLSKKAAKARGMRRTTWSQIKY